MTGNRTPLLWVIGLLVLLNLTTLGMIWRREVRVPAEGSGADRPDEAAIGRFLQSELSLSDDQMQQFAALRQRHAQQVRRLREEINDLKREQLMAQLAEAAPDTARARQTAGAIATRQFDLELSTFQHFAELRALFGHEQVQELRSLLLELFMGPGRQGPQSAAPPPQQPGPPGARALGEDGVHPEARPLQPAPQPDPQAALPSGQTADRPPGARATQAPPPPGGQSPPPPPRPDAQREPPPPR
jgi:Spy/CpxP family protein refolding chaperone